MSHLDPAPHGQRSYLDELGSLRTLAAKLRAPAVQSLRIKALPCGELTHPERRSVEPLEDHRVGVDRDEEHPRQLAADPRRVPGGEPVGTVERDRDGRAFRRVTDSIAKQIHQNLDDSARIAVCSA